MTDEMKLLAEYLNQYYRAVDRRKTLENRLKIIMKEMEKPIRGIDYKPVNYRTNDVSVGSAAFTLRKSEIESRIVEQIYIAQADLLKIMDVLDYLPPNDDKRLVLELRYIDLAGWDKIAQKMNRSRSGCFEWHAKALETLLTYKRVQKIIEEYATQKQAPGG